MPPKDAHLWLGQEIFPRQAYRKTLPSLLRGWRQAVVARNAPATALTNVRRSITEFTRWSLGSGDCVIVSLSGNVASSQHSTTPTRCLETDRSDATRPPSKGQATSPDIHGLDVQRLTSANHPLTDNLVGTKKPMIAGFQVPVSVAVLRLINSSIFVGCSIGSIPGLCTLEDLVDIHGRLPVISPTLGPRTSARRLLLEF
jgi:hypothetical protein